MEKRFEEQLGRDFARLADGDRSAFASVFEVLWPEVRRFCRRALGSEADADDAAQHTLSKLFEQAADYDPSRSPLAWAYAIALWECKTLRRKTARRRAEPLDPGQADGTPSPERLLEEKDLALALDESMGKLSPDDQATLRALLRSEAPGDSTFRKRKQRALTRLREIWRTSYGT